MPPWNALVAGTELCAKQFLEAFQLSEEIWLPAYLGMPIPPGNLERIVVLPPQRLAAYDQEAFSQEVDRWRTRLSRTGSLVVLRR